MSVAVVVPNGSDSAVSVGVGVAVGVAVGAEVAVGAGVAVGVGVGVGVGVRAGAGADVGVDAPTATVVGVTVGDAPGWPQATRSTAPRAQIYGQRKVACTAPIIVRAPASGYSKSGPCTARRASDAPP